MIRGHGGNRILALKSVAVLSAIAGAGVFALSPRVTHADALSDQMDSVCGAVTGAVPPSPAPGAQLTDAQATQQQKIQYCQAAQSAKDAGDADDALWKVWAGVATVCTATCVTSMTSVYTNQWICTGVNVAAGVGDAAATRDFAALLTSLGTSGAGMLMNATMNSHSDSAATTASAAGKDAKAAPKKDKDYASCITAATAAATSFAKFSSVQSQRATEQQNVNSAAGLGSTNTAATSMSPSLAALNGSGSSTGTGGTTSAVSLNPDAQPSIAVSACGTSALGCAVAADANLPGFVSNPKFQSDFRKAAGMDFGDFLNNASSPEPAMAGAMAGSLSSAQSAKVASALETLKEHVSADDDGTFVAGGGGAAAGAGDDSGAALGDMMQNLMAQMNPKKKQAEGPQGLKDVAFAYQRSPASASLAENRKLSIFDRVTYRYYFVSRAMLSAPQGGTQ